MTAPKKPNPGDEPEKKPLGNQEVAQRIQAAEKEARARRAQTAMTPGTQQTEARRMSPAADELHAAAGKVGVLRVPLGSTSVYGSTVGQFVGEGQGGAPVDAAVLFDAEPNGTWHAQVYRPGRLRDGGEHPTKQPGSFVWAAGEVRSARDMPDIQTRPLLAIYGPSTAAYGEPWDELEALAAETGATVAIVRPADVREVTWTVGRQEPEPEPEPEPAASRSARVRDLQWLESVRQTLRASDAGSTAIRGPDGERLELHFEQRDNTWRAKGFDEEQATGELVGIRVNVAPGLTLPLADIPLRR